ncbi:MAG: DUF2103 domain-containing protein [Synechococcales bacterium]|nr:DUF2103 domain-containing protein [Synechococcales bacterium]
MTQAQGRVVLNHSTHIPGLIPVLEKLVQHPSIQTITPGVICSVRAHMPHLRLRVSVPIRGGFKLIARAGKIAQEVFVLTSMGQTDLETAIGQILEPK